MSLLEPACAVPRRLRGRTGCPHNAVFVVWSFGNLLRLLVRQCISKFPLKRKPGLDATRPGVREQKYMCEIVNLISGRIATRLRWASQPPHHSSYCVLFSASFCSTFWASLRILTASTARYRSMKMLAWCENRGWSMLFRHAAVPDPFAHLPNTHRLDCRSRPPILDKP